MGLLATADRVEHASPGLTAAEMQRYNDDGYLCPVPAIGAAQAQDAVRRLEALETVIGHGLTRDQNLKPHLFLKWASDIVTHPAILDAVEALIGPDILCWSGRFFVKNPGDGGFVSWHQDSTYWGLSAAEEILTAWVALAPTTVANGAMKVVPGTHKRQIEPHRENGANNMLLRGQEIAVDVDEARAVHLILGAGEMSLHHNRIFHGSDQITSDTRRMGFAIRYIPAWVRQTTGLEDSALLVRGKSDPRNNFVMEQTPRFDLDPDGVMLHGRVAAAYAKVNAKAAAMHAAENAARR